MIVKLENIALSECLRQLNTISALKAHSHIDFWFVIFKSLHVVRIWCKCTFVSPLHWNLVHQPTFRSPVFIHFVQSPKSFFALTAICLSRKKISWSHFYEKVAFCYPSCWPSMSLDMYWYLICRMLRLTTAPLKFL